MFAVIAQIATFTWLGLACGIAYLFCENVEFDPVKQVAVSYTHLDVYKRQVYTDSPEAFKYYRFTDAQSPEEFDAYIDKCKELSLYNTGVSAAVSYTHLVKSRNLTIGRLKG